MDLEALEYHKVIDIIESFCFSNYGKDYLKNLFPSMEPEEELLKVGELMEELQYDGEPPLGGIFYLKDQFHKIRQGFLISPPELLKFRDFFMAIHRLKEFYEKLKEKYPRIWKTVSDMEEAPQFCSETARCFSDDGRIKDSASAYLKEIRTEIKKTVSYSKNLIERLVRKYKDFLQDPPYVQREGRYVFLVKSSHRRNVRGMLIASSSSGMTIYVEPEEMIFLNNKLKQLELEEKNEERRITREILQLLVNKEKRILSTMHKLSYFDSLYARAKYGIKNKAIIPKVSRDGIIKLMNARHPLISDEKVVPISIEIDKDKYGIILTGPNTGGKTVALKTVGLFTLMVMAGIPVPCDEKSIISIFEEIKADIGDEQSIEQSLSTFSSHIMKIIDMMKTANERTLLLIDEIGAGTDPIEGAALAIAIINYLLGKKSKIIVTTHLTPLKLYAFEDDRLVNAAVEFDIETLKPTYRIIMGIAGSSQALEIAKRLGIPNEVLELSKKYIDERLKNVDVVIHKLQTERIKVEKEKREIEKLKKELKSKHEILTKEIEKLKTRRTHKLLQELDEISKQLKEVKKILETAVAEARRAKNLEKLEKINKEIQRIDPNFIDKLKDSLISHKNVDNKNFREGDIVKVVGTASVGKVLKLDNDKAIVDVNGIKFETSIDKLEKAQIDALNFKDETGSLTVAKNKGVYEIDIRGMTVDEAEEIVERFIDNLISNNMNRGYIIHGKGTLKLAKGVRKILQLDPRIKNFRFAPPEEGGAGVTIVEIN